MDSNRSSEKATEFRYDPQDDASASVSGPAQLRRLENVLLREVLERLYQIHPDAPRARETADLPSEEEIEDSPIW